MANHTSGKWLHKTTSWINNVPASITILTESENHMTGKSIARIEPELGVYDHNGRDRYRYSQEETEANAAYIVKCCNNYERLLSALKGAQHIIEQQINATPTGDIRNALCDANISIIGVIQSS